MEDDERNELNIHRVDTHISLQSDQKKPPIDELPAPHVEEISDKKGEVVPKMPQVRWIIVLEGFHIRNQTATYRQHSQDENKKRKCQPDPSKRQSVMFGILPHHEEEQERKKSVRNE
jgi:hypothetical protein